MNARRKKKAIIEGRAEPWEVEPAWRDGRIRPESGGEIAYILIGLLSIGVASIIVWTFVRQAGAIGFLLLVATIPVVFLLIFRPLRGLRAKKKYPGVHLKPSAIPVAPGERFECVLYSGADPTLYSASGVTFHIRVTANKWVERSTAGDNNRTRKVRSVIWEEKIPVAAASGTSELGSALIGRFAVDLPEELEETSRLPATITYDWRLEVDATKGMPGFRYAFRLPVFDTRTALEKADHALGTVTDTTAATDIEELTRATAFRPPVAKGDLDGLKAYQDAILDDRRSRDGRATSERLFRAMQAHTHIERLGDRAVSVIHVRGDRAVRRMRRLSAAAIFLFMFFVPGGLRLLFFSAAVILFAMGRSAKPTVVAVHADDTGLEIDTVRGRKARSSHYPWSSIGMIYDHRYSSAHDYHICIVRPKLGARSIGARIPSQREAEGIAAAISSVKDRYR